LDKKLLKHLVDLAQNVPLAGGAKSLNLVAGNGFTGIRLDEVPQMKELDTLETLGYIRLIPASGIIYDIRIGEKAINYFK